MQNFLNREEIVDEIQELEADQHPNFLRDSNEGRERMIVLLQKLNRIDKK